ncbi:uncharacterized protein [Triticum aestivum]|uniref:uncharacterized protein isoform X2 n=1 Tax=Triticum aestivum TaxID=4565 RepID=UPI001D00C458|nr:uncharacterized protein LOC123181129 isoform X2 [Triticum aestivum]
MEQSSRRRRCRCRAPGGRATDQTPTSSSASSSHGATNPRSAAPPRPHIRQSVLYSDRPRRSRKPTSDKLPVEEHAGEVSSREFQVSTHHQSRSTRESTYRSKECAYDTAESKTGSEIVEEEKLADESDPWAQEYREILEYLAEHRYTDVVEAMIAASHGFSNPAQHKLDAEAFWSSGEELKFPEVSKSFASPTENSVQGEPSTKDIIENAKKWMGEEVMVAFKKYIKWQDQFKDVEYSLDELQHQCFSVESYDHTFHHFNFTVKMKKPDGDDWSSTPYFAQVKEIYGRKYYTCYELSSYDDGHCYACINQGMHALKHPIGEFGYDGGHPDTGSPFIYLSDDE